VPDIKAILMPITPICSGDSFYFAVPIFSEKTGGLIDEHQYVCLVTGVLEEFVPANFRMSTSSVSYPVEDETVEDEELLKVQTKKFP
jgi:energy-converting hydrogenase Eha subunit F